MNNNFFTSRIQVRSLFLKLCCVGLLLVGFSVLLVQCKKNTEVAKIVVTFDLNGGSGSIPEQTIENENGDKVVEPAVEPTRTDYVFTGWFTDKEATNKFDFEKVVTASLTLYAGWNRYVDIPDENFRNYLKSLPELKDAFNAEGKLDALHNSVMTLKELRPTNLQIKSLVGIEYFKAIDTLFCSYNQLTSLDLSRNKALTRLYCDGNQLTSLDLSKNIALKKCWFSDNPLLTSLDLSKNTALESVLCIYSRLISLDISGMSVIQSSADADKHSEFNRGFDPNAPKLSLIVKKGLENSAPVQDAKTAYPKLEVITK